MNFEGSVYKRDGPRRAGWLKQQSYPTINWVSHVQCDWLNNYELNWFILGNYCNSNVYLYITFIHLADAKSTNVSLFVSAGTLVR